MTREALPFTVPDLSQFARTLGRSLKERHSIKPEPPGHVELLNLLARASGYRNVQSLRVAASRLPPPAPSADEVVPAPSLSAAARKALTQFDARGRLARWPHKFSVQRLAMWVLWTLFDAKRVYSEREVNEILKAWHTYGDHVTLRVPRVDAPRVAAQLLAEVAVADLTIEDPPIEDVIEKVFATERVD